MSKLHMGFKSGRAGLWVAADGQNASAENQNFVTNSDWSHLQLHERIYTVREGSAGGMPGVPDHNFPQKTLMFDVPLTYEPLVMVLSTTFSSGSTGKLITYPPSFGMQLYTDVYGDTWDMAGSSYEAQNDRVILLPAMDWRPYQQVHVWVFKNRAIP